MTQSGPLVSLHVVLGVLSFNSILYGVGICMYLWRRQLFPIKQRLPAIAAGEMTAIFFVSITLSASNYLRSDSIAKCSVVVSIVIFLDMIGVLCVAGRIGWLLLKDMATQELLKRDLRNSKELEASVKKKCEETIFVCAMRFLYKRTSSPKKQVLIYLTPFFISSALGISILWWRQEVIQSFWFENICFEEVTKSVLTIGFGWIYIFICGTFFGIRLLKMNDNFNFATEIRMLLVHVCLLIICSATAFVYLPISGRPLTAESLEIYGIVLVSFFIPVFFMIQCWYPVVLSFLHQMKQSRMKQSKTSDNSLRDKLLTPASTVASLNHELERVISSTHAREQFLNFLKSEFAVENLFFFEECANFKRQAEGNTLAEELTRTAIEIRDNYVCTSAPYSVNISFTTRKAVLEDLATGKINANTFENAQTEIFNLMVRDSFVRFKYSKFSTALENTEFSQSVFAPLDLSVSDAGQ
jgi:hypothetical protein